MEPSEAHRILSGSPVRKQCWRGLTQREIGAILYACGLPIPPGERIPPAPGDCLNFSVDRLNELRATPIGKGLGAKAIRNILRFVGAQE